MGYITTRDNVRLYVKDWGTGPPVVMMHGWPLSSDTFDDLSVAIADAGRRAIAYDRRGFGRSDQPWTGYDYDTLADDLADVIKATSATGATILGFSMGGGEVARYLARHDGNHVRQAILVASVVPYLLKTDDNVHGVESETFDSMKRAIVVDRARFWANFFDDFYGVGIASHPVGDEVIEWSRDVAMQASLKATLACANAFATTDFRGDLAAFQVPTLVIHGASDKIVPVENARAAAAAIRNSTLIEYDGAPHGLFASNKTRLTSDVLQFIGED